MSYDIEVLSPREREVLAEIATGSTKAVTAVRLGVSGNTIHTHIKNIYQKLGINSRSEAALAAVRLELVKV